MDGLLRQIYHERQEPGSNLCAQHALNSLLQGNYFSPADLATIASHLDEEEQAVRDPHPGTSTSQNMDDTGFFSIQVLENAVAVWNLKLVRWRSEELRPYQAAPEFQPAFILNLESHWYTLRRFGDGNHNFHWFNLNSFSKKPEWISSTFLDMTLQQAEQEGYSVFAVRPLTGDSLNPLPESVADNIATGVEPPRHNPTNPTNPSAMSRTMQAALEDDGDHVMGSDFIEDEDLDLQRVLQESLLGAQSHNVFTTSGPVETEADVPMPDEAFAAFQASAARQRQALSLARAEQEEALRETAAAEAASGRRRRTTGDEEEEEMLRRAMAESLELAKVAEASAGNDALKTSATAQQVGEPTTTSSLFPAPSSGRPLGRRVLDDEDEELQAALRASLQDVPDEFTVPEPAAPPSRPESSRPSGTATPSRPAPAVASPIPAPAASAPEPEEEVEEVSNPPSPVQERQPTMDEVRRMRLARFGQ